MVEPKRLRRRKKPAPKQSLLPRSVGRVDAQPHGDGEAAAEPDAQDGFPIVGIGASTAEIEAVRTFLEGLPHRSGMAFVLLSPGDPSADGLTAPRLSDLTDVPVVEVQNAAQLAPDRVYVVPPNRAVAVREGRIYLPDPHAESNRRSPIDQFFLSLAAARKERSIGVLLSGAGPDGLLGLREIKAAGGMTMVRQPGAAEQRACEPATIDLVDLVLPVREMPAALIRYIRQLAVERTAQAALDRAAPEEFRAVLELVRTESGHDFSKYKKATLNRRIQRRMRLRQLDSLGDYLALGREDPEEVRSLFRDLLIGVTRFFRDPNCWASLGEVTAKIVEERGSASQPLRVWVPGCSTGEEVYSHGIALSEQCSSRGKRLPLHLFGTDIDERGIAVARSGIYSGSAAEDLSPARIEEFFEVRGPNLVVAKHLRDAAVFATQDLLTDPPFSSLDLISCRNVMIYLEPSLQRRLIEMFHFALRPGGVLFLGPSESAARPERLFEPLSSTHRIYRRSEAPRSGAATFPLMPSARIGRGRPARGVRPSADPAAVARRALIETFAPAAVLVNDAHEVLYAHGQLRHFLDLPASGVARDVAELALPGLGRKLRSALRTARERQERIEVVANRVRRGARTVAVRITVVPVSEQAQAARFLIGFAELSPPDSAEQRAPDAGREAAASAGDDVPEVAQLQFELNTAREDLLGTIEALEASNAGLQASNAEVRTMSEERQSANEELETSQEELQSLNEELTTVNSHLEEKLEQLASTNDDLTNLLSSTEIATVFLDEDLCIRRFTPAMVELLNVIDSDVGRPLSDLAPRVDDPQLLEDARGALEETQGVQREVEDGGGRSFLRRVLPYRTSDRRKRGIVVTYTDVTDLRNARARVEARERQQALVAEFGRKALVSTDIHALCKDAVRLVARGLGTEFVKLSELLPSGKLLLRAGVGWRRGLVGKAILPTGLDSQSGFTLRSSRPIIVEDLSQEHRFALPDLLSAHDVKSGMSVIVGKVDAPWGVLGAHAAKPRSFTMDDVHFLEAVANVLADAIARSEAEARLRRRAHEMSLLFHATSIVATSFESALQSCIDAVCEITGYPIGHAFLPSADHSRFVSSGIWHVDDEERTRELREITADASFELGEGFIGTIWETRDVLTVPDLRKSRIFKRLGTKLKLCGAFGFPVIVGDEVAAILEFFTPMVIASENEPLDMVRSLGAQVGRVYERNRAERSLRESAERLSLALEAGELGAFDWDVDTGRISWNEEHYSMLGYEPGEVGPTHDVLLDRVHPDDRSRLQEAVQVAERDRTSFECEYRVVLPDGRIRWMHGKGGFLSGSEGSLSRMYGVQMDVTARRELEAGLREADRRKNAFLSTLGHELRNPLGAVANAVQLLRTSSDVAEEARELAEMMERQIRQMTNLLNDLLDVGRISRGGVALNVAPVKLAELVEQALETSRGDIEAAEHDVRISIDPPDLAVMADPVRLEQILVNLLSNAARYTPLPGSIEVAASRSGAEVSIAVSDDGIGLRRDEVADIFEPFYQVKKGSGGLGLGLSLVRRLAELHGGRVEVSSPGLGQGSVFTVVLPGSDAARDDEEPITSGRSGTSGASQPRFRDLRVLAIDDHQDSLSALGALLGKHCAIATATTGEGGIAEARRRKPDVVLIDLALPDMSGFEVAAAFESEPELKGVMRIAMTGFGDAQTEAEVADAGFDEHLLKPIDFGSLLRLLSGAAARRGDAGQARNWDE